MEKHIIQWSDRGRHRMAMAVLLQSYSRSPMSRLDPVKVTPFRDENLLDMQIQKR